MTTDVEIVNSALLQMGADVITSFTDEVREAQIANVIYDEVLETTLQKYPWRFSLNLDQLSQDTTTKAHADEFGFQWSYQLPSDSLRIIRINQPTDNYIVVGDRILSNVEPVFVEYQFKPTPDKWPGYFRNAFVLEMAARFSISIAEDSGKYSLFQQKADLELARARHIDAQEQPVPDVGENNFLFTFVRT